MSCFCVEEGQYMFTNIYNIVKIKGMALQEKLREN